MVRSFNNEIKESTMNVNDIFGGYVLNDSTLYEKYKTHQIIIMDPDTKIAMEVLVILENLGFPMDRLGTLYYKDLIVWIIKLLSADLASRQDIESALESPYSQLYFDVARNELDIGIKSFKEIVQDAFEKIDLSSANPELLESVRSKMENAVSCNQLPLVIAEHSKLLNTGRTS